MSWIYYISRFLVRILLSLLTRCQVKGKENIPGQGPLLVVANHLNLADPPIVSISLGRTAMFMAKEELFRSRLSSYFISRLGVFPVHRGRLDRKALRQAERALARDLALVMFPEGSRSQNGQLQPAFPGAALIARRYQVPILPIGITGTERIKGITWILHRPQITVNIGHPFQLPVVNGKITKVELAKMSELIMEHVADLLPAIYRGNYTGRKADGTKH